MSILHTSSAGLEWIQQYSSHVNDNNHMHMTHENTLLMPGKSSISLRSLPFQPRLFLQRNIAVPSRPLGSRCHHSFFSTPQVPYPFCYQQLVSFPVMLTINCHTLTSTCIHKRLTYPRLVHLTHSPRDGLYHPHSMQHGDIR